jgi:hypothetical protein
MYVLELYLNVSLAYPYIYFFAGATVFKMLSSSTNHRSPVSIDNHTVSRRWTVSLGGYRPDLLSKLGGIERWGRKSAAEKEDWSSASWMPLPPSLRQ